MKTQYGKMDFLKDYWVLHFLNGVSYLFLALMLPMFGVNLYGLVFVLFILISLQGAYLGHTYFRRYRYYLEIHEQLEAIDQKHLIMSLIDSPNFNEGMMVYDVLLSATQSMNDELAKFRYQSREYKDYIETWVHEIKTPLAACRLILDNSGDQLKPLMQDEVLRIEEYVEQALFYARSNHVEKDYAVKPFLLEPLVNDVIKRHARVLIQAGMRIEKSQLQLPVYTDEKWFGFILGQLLSNAIKYSESGGLLKFSAVEAQQSVVFTLEDTGVGIAPEDLSRVFEKGFVGTNGRRQQRSTGIGLYLVKRLCDKMNLEVQITSKVGQGTRVALVFPKSDHLL